MMVLYLGPDRPTITNFIQSCGDSVLHRQERLTGDDPDVVDADLLVSYGYRYILKPEVLKHFPGKAVNLHISLLPWNKGADPNLWSFLEDTPKGVTIHLMDEKLDTGDIVAQREVDMTSVDTLRTSYEKLTTEVEALFKSVWPQFRTGRFQPRKQPSGGSYHRLQDKEPFMSLLHQGWDTPVEELIGRALVSQEQG